MDPIIRIQSEPFDPSAELAQLYEGAGALVTFTGYVRADDGVCALRLEHYPGMTECEIARHVRDAQSRWSLLGVKIVHRVGELTSGEAIVLVAVAAVHRREAFAACEYLMDLLKTKAPFWKQEKKGAAAQWVEAKASDDAAAERWVR
jgi:molybdopterin synthase catalytic subunit